MQRLQIFKPGRHTATDGRVIEFTEDDLKASAGAYDPAKHEAPLVIGHPRTEDPAYGWARALAYAEGVLCADPHQVEASFAEMVNAGRFKKISASFYPPDHQANPVPGVYYLRHIGFLGAKPPALKGLKSAQFAGDEAGILEFADWGGTMVASLFRGIRDFFIERFGLEAADKVLPDYTITALTERAAQDEPPTARYSERTTGDPQMTTKDQEIAQREAKLKEDQDKLATERAEFAEQEKRRKEKEASERRTAIAARIDAAVKATHLLPRDRDAALAFASSLGPDSVLEFGEGNQKTSKPALEWFLEYVERQPKQVDTGERGKGTGAPADTEDANEIARRALEYQESEAKAGRTITVTQAVTHVTRQANQ